MTTLERIEEQVKAEHDKFYGNANSDDWAQGEHYAYHRVLQMIADAEQEPRLWNNHQVACLLADMFGDNCACNFNGIDEWLPELCDFKDNCCPNPIGVACWEQFLKHSRARYCECGYEMR